MALTPMQTALCNKLATDYALLTGPIKGAEALFKAKMGMLDTFVRGMTFSNPVDLDAALLGFSNQVQGLIPGANLQDMDELASFMQACSFFSDMAPTTAVSGTSNGIFSNIDKIIGDLTPSFPEFGAGAIADGINMLLNGVGIPGGSDISDKLKKANDLLGCLTGLCGPGFAPIASEISDDLNDIYSTFNIIDSGPDEGKFDFKKLYDDSGLSTAQQNALNTVTTSIGNQKKGATTAITNSIDTAKELKKKVGGFF
jgi:hypothetical protein